jgi:TP901 family phage tail tape measure protein
MPSSVGTVFVDVRFNTGNLGTDLSRSLGGAAGAAGAAAGAEAGAGLSRGLGASLTTLGTSMGNLGRQVSLGLSLPLIAFGRAASNAFASFDTAMTQTSALAGVNAKTVDAWRGEVMDLGAEYGVMAADAAKGLYFIASSGVEAADAMGVLEVATKGEAIQLGSTAQVADVVTSAMNQYGKENISAAQAADILTAAVREGKGEADDMAGALSRVIPLAGSMGVSFGEVAGVMSALTLSGTSSDEAATQINALLTSLQKLPKDAQQSMKALTGLDYATVQNDLKTKGLTETLREIYNAFGDNEDAIAKVFGNVRALRGITGLFGEKEEQTRRVVDATTHAMGAQDKALQDTQASAAYALRQSQAEFDNAMTSIGASVTPVVAGFTSFAASVVNFTAIFGPAGQKVLVFVGTIAAAAGPLLYMGSSIMRLGGNLIDLSSKLKIGEKIATLAESGNVFGRALTAIIPKLVQFKGAIIGGTAAIAAGIITYQFFTAKVHELDEAYRQLGEEGKEKTAKSSTFDELTQRVTIANEGIARTNEEIGRLQERDAKGGLFSNLNLGLAQAMNNANSAGQTFVTMGQDAQSAVDQVVAISDRFGLTRDAATKWVLSQRAAGVVYKSNEEALKAYDEALRRGDASTKEATDSTNAAKNTWEGLMAAVKGTSDMFFAAESAQTAYNSALKKIEDAKKGVATAEKNHRDAVADVVTAQRNEVKANEAVAASTRKVEDAKIAAAEAQKALDDALAGPSVDEKLDLRSARLAVREAREAMSGSGQSGLDRERNAITLARAREDLKRAEAAHDGRIADARKDVASATDAVRDAEQSRQDAIAAAAAAHQATLDAQVKERDTLNEIWTAQGNVTQAQKDAVQPALDLAGAQGALAIGFQTGTIEADKFREYLIKLKDLYPELGTELQNYLDKFDQWEKDHPKTAIPPPPAPPPPLVSPATPYRATPTPSGEGKYIPGVGYVKGNRAIGGPVGAGSLYEVNERNVPELFSAGGRQYLLPVSSGRVTPVAVKGGDGASVGDIHVYGQTQPVQTAYEVRRQLRVKARTKV